MRSGKPELRHHQQSFLPQTSLMLSATGSLELRFVSSAVLEYTNNTTSRILLGLVIVSNDRRTYIHVCLHMYVCAEQAFLADNMCVNGVLQLQNMYVEELPDGFFKQNISSKNCGSVSSSRHCEKIVQIMVPRLNTCCHVY